MAFLPRSPRHLLGFLGLSFLLGCGDKASVPQANPGSASVPLQAATARISFVSFTTVREAYEKKIIPDFVELWRRGHRQDVEFVQSYDGSSQQAQAIAGGVEADVAALSHAEDIDLLVHEGFVRSDWRSGPHGAIVSRSAVVLAVREGNPLNIQDWADLRRPGIAILTPDPATSGGGRWNVAAIYGAAVRGKAGDRERTPAGAERLLSHVLQRVVSFEPDARTSFKEFEDGRGDVAITSESEVMRSRMFGHEVEWIVPPSTLRMDNPAVVVDANADRHGVREIAEAFVEYLSSPQAQRTFALRGLRPVDPAIAAEFPDSTHPVEDLWGIEDLGGWERVSKDLFSPGGVFERARAAARQD